jgi:hypothetical protein
MVDDRNDINRPVDTGPSVYERPRTSSGSGFGWGIPAGIAAMVLIVAAIIFSSAGPDRSRTTAYKDTVPSAVNPSGGGDGSQRAKTSNPDMPTAPKSQ